MNIEEALKLKFPEEWAKRLIRCSDYGHGAGPYISTWDASLGPLPTEEELTQWVVDMEPAKYEQDQRQKRREEYPAFGDQLDAILKHFELKEAAGTVLSPELKIIKDEWRAVKDKYPLVEAK